MFTLRNIHFLSWSFILIKDQIVQNVPPKSLILADRLTNVNTFELWHDFKNLNGIFYNHDYSSQTREFELSKLNSR